MLEMTFVHGVGICYLDQVVGWLAFSSGLFGVISIIGNGLIKD